MRHQRPFKRKFQTQEKHLSELLHLTIVNTMIKWTEWMRTTRIHAFKVNKRNPTETEKYTTCTTVKIEKPRQAGNIKRGYTPITWTRSQHKHWVVMKTYRGPQHILRGTYTWREQMVAMLGPASGKTVVLKKKKKNHSRLAASKQGLGG